MVRAEECGELGRVSVSERGDEEDARCKVKDAGVLIARGKTTHGGTKKGMEKGSVVLGNEVEEQGAQSVVEREDFGLYAVLPRERGEGEGC